MCAYTKKARNIVIPISFYANVINSKKKSKIKIFLMHNFAIRNITEYNNLKNIYIVYLYHFQ